MEYEVVHLTEKKIVGLAARTNNTDPSMGQIIGGMWNDFYQKGIYEAIEHKANDKALGIYTDYTLDQSGDYTAMVACEVTKIDHVVEPMQVRTIPEGNYAKFVVRGHMQQAVAAFWQELWKMDMPRTFKYDFEEYQDACMDDATIHIYIGVR